MAKGKKITGADLAPTAGAVNQLILELNKLPGIGVKSAQRLAYHLLRASEEEVRMLSEALLAVKQTTRLCSVCFNATDADPCPLCTSDRRDKSLLCIVEQPQDILALEHTGAFHGLYHVLHGAISPTEGIGAGDIKIRELLHRLEDGVVKEVILATNPTMEGEQTALYLGQLITPLGIRLTRIARGLPYGSELEYADDVTLTHALEGRREL